jgi:hypothetical protein
MCEAVDVMPQVYLQRGVAELSHEIRRSGESTDQGFVKANKKP